MRPRPLIFLLSRLATRDSEVIEVFKEYAGRDCRRQRPATRCLPARSARRSWSRPGNRCPSVSCCAIPPSGDGLSGGRRAGPRVAGPPPRRTAARRAELSSIFDKLIKQFPARHLFTPRRNPHRRRGRCATRWRFAGYGRGHRARWLRLGMSGKSPIAGLGRCGRQAVGRNLRRSHS
jgi:hypothetical protein